MKKIERPLLCCLACKGLFTPRLKPYLWHTLKFCGHKCAHQFRSQTSRDKRTRTCPSCKQSFLLHSAKQGLRTQHGQSACSKRCAKVFYFDRMKSDTVRKKCLSCGAEFSETRKVVDRYMHGQSRGWTMRKYCSKRCFADYGRYGGGGTSREVLERLLRKGMGTKTKAGCLIWAGCKTSEGYGISCHIGRHVILAHRLAYALRHGAINRREIIRHTCDTPSCVNPEHLLAGSHVDNMRDKRERDRGVKGLSHHASKGLDKYRRIKKQIEDGMPRHLIALRNDCSPVLVYRISRRRHFIFRLGLVPGQDLDSVVKTRQ